MILLHYFQPTEIIRTKIRSQNVNYFPSNNTSDDIGSNAMVMSSNTGLGIFIQWDDMFYFNSDL